MASPSHISSLPTIWHWIKDHPTPHVLSDIGDATHIIVPVYLKGESWQIPSEHLPHTELSSYLNSLSWKNAQGCREYAHNGKNYIFVPLASDHASYGLKRTSRQFGLNCAALLKNALQHLTQIAFASSSKLSLPHVLNGWINGLYEVRTFKSSPAKSWRLQKIQVLPAASSNEDSFKATMQEQVHLAQAQIITRYLGDTPANHMTPQIFAAFAEELATTFKFEVQIIGKEQLQEWGMHSLLSVSQGSENPPRVIIARIPSSQASSRPVVLVGKGVTFDSGGISLKPPAHMHEMKYDMLGGATVLGALCHVAAQDAALPYDVVGLIGCVENMPAYAATRPGDVVTSYGGKTIEILNTDAEGRLVLADLLGYAQKVVEAGAIINAATLTGACLVALGSVGAALMSHTDSWKKHLQHIAEEEEEPLWELPLWQDLQKAMDSQVADLKNIGGAKVRAGTITAGIFLSKFVEPATPWAHLDIAGVGWECQSRGYPQKGASGYGVSLMAQAALKAQDFYDAETASSPNNT